MNADMYVYMYVCTHAHALAAYMQIYTHAYNFACMYVGVHTLEYTNIETDT